MKLYLSGPMTGRPNFNYDTFNEVAEELRQRFHQVINPAEIEFPDPGLNKNSTETWAHYLSHAIRVMLDCSIIVLLPEWETSRGAVVEVNLADVLNYHVFELDMDTYQFKPTKYGNQDYTKVEM